MFDTYKLIDPNGQRRRLICNTCQRETIHTVEAHGCGRWSDDEVMIYAGEDDYILRCGACDTVAFVSSTWNSEDTDYDHEGQEHAVRYDKQYPVPTSKDFIFDQDHTPAKLNNLLHELISAYASSLLIATTLLLRLVVEFISGDLKCKGRTLKDKIDDMAAKGFIDEEQKKLFHVIREHGNSGAHGAIAMTPTKIVAAMSVINLLIEKHYNAPGREKQIMTKAQEVLSPPTNPKSSGE
jgi:hypothetical protein